MSSFFPPLFSQQPAPGGEVKDKPLETIMQLGQMPMPAQDQDMNFHCMSIVGQIEGHIILPRKTKQPNMNILFRSLLPSPKAKPSRAFWSF